jgi:hypothetical protein
MSTVSKQFALSEMVRLGNENTLLSLALSDALNGAVKWFGHSPAYNLGISRPTGAAGGIVIKRNGGLASAHYWEDFAHRELPHIADCITGEDTEHNHDLLCRRRTIEDAQAYVSAAQKAD